MDQPLHTYMRPGLVLCVAYPDAAEDSGALERGVEAVATDPFFTAVEVRYVPDDAARRRIRDVLRLSRLGVVYEAQPRLRRAGLDLNGPDAHLRQSAVDEGKRAIDEAADIGALRVNMVSGPQGEANRRDAAVDALFDSLCALAAYADGGPTLALEPYACDGPDCYLIGPTSVGIDLVRLVREVYPAFSLTLDTGHMTVMGDDIAASLAAAAPYLGQLHLANAQPGGGTTAPPFGVAGVYDVARVTEVLLMLFRTGFLGVGRRPFILFRVAPRAGERPEWIVAGAKRTLMEAWNRL